MTITYKPHISKGGSRLARSLEVLWAQVNAAYPKRSKVSDGWIGDESHQARKSDHNPGPDKVIRAIDITHDPASGFDSYAFADMLRVKNDARIGYIISNKRISNPTIQGGAWRPYNGSNPHNKHVHISVKQPLAIADDDAEWDIRTEGVSLPPPPPPPAKPIVVTEPVLPSIRDQMARSILAQEAKRDSSGRLEVHHPSASIYEVGGITSNSHPALAKELVALLEQGQHAEAERRVLKFILEYTNDAAGWTQDAGVEFYLRDCIYNRGKEGGAKILQMAVGADPDGTVGPTTREYRDKLSPEELLTRLRTAREQYEIQTYGKREQYWRGLTARWDRILNEAKGMRSKNSVPVSSKEVAATVTTTAAAGGAAAAAKKGYDIDWGTVAIIIAIPIMLVVACIVLMRKLSRKPA